MELIFLKCRLRNIYQMHMSTSPSTTLSISETKHNLFLFFKFVLYTHKKKNFYYEKNMLLVGLFRVYHSWVVSLLNYKVLADSAPASQARSEPKIRSIYRIGWQRVVLVSNFVNIGREIMKLDFGHTCT